MWKSDCSHYGGYIDFIGWVTAKWGSVLDWYLVQEGTHNGHHELYTASLHWAPRFPSSEKRFCHCQPKHMGETSCMKSSCVFQGCPLCLFTAVFDSTTVSHLIAKRTKRAKELCKHCTASAFCFLFCNLQEAPGTSRKGTYFGIMELLRGNLDD